MNKKDYKAIAQIIECQNYCLRIGTEKRILLNIITKLADYFERAEKELNSDYKIKDMFNREQFLKDCGVGE